MGFGPLDRLSENHATFVSNLGPVVNKAVSSALLQLVVIGSASVGLSLAFIGFTNPTAAWVSAGVQSTSLFAQLIGGVAAVLVNVPLFLNFVRTGKFCSPLSSPMIAMAMDVLSLVLMGVQEYFKSQLTDIERAFFVIPTVVFAGYGFYTAWNDLVVALYDGDVIPEPVSTATSVAATLTLVTTVSTGLCLAFSSTCP